MQGADMKEFPLVSVVTASYNMGRYVGLAVDSVLAQDYPALEIIVVDDGSTDDTSAVLSRYRDDPRVKLIFQENAGQTVAKNRGVQAARGEYIAFCDADNLWLPNKLSRQIELFNEHNDIAVVYGDISLIDADGQPLPTTQAKRYSGKITGRLLIDNFVTFNTAVVSRKVMTAVGGFDESLRMGIDYDLWLRISVKHTFHYIAEPLVRYRIWGGQMSNRQEERLSNCFRLLNNFLEKYPESVTAAEVARGWAHTYVSRGLLRASQQKYLNALEDYYKAFSYRPCDLRLWKSIAKLLIGR